MHLQIYRSHWQLDSCMYFLCLLLCSALQHGTQWASSGCVLCSCTHGKVSCTPIACPVLTCGRGELPYTAQGACCPTCVGLGGEYCVWTGYTLGPVIQVVSPVWKYPFSCKFRKLFFLCLVPLERHWGQMFCFILFPSSYPVCIFNSFTHRPIASSKIVAVSRCA